MTGAGSLGSKFFAVVIVTLSNILDIPAFVRKTGGQIRNTTGE